MLIHYNEDRARYEGAVVPPIYQNSLFVFEDWQAIDQAFDDPSNACIYSRGKNPGVAIVEEKIAKLCGGERAKMFASGMGAISSAIMHCVKSGDHIIAINNTYGPANNFIKNYINEKCGIESSFVDGKNLSDFEEAIQPNTTLIYLESPSTAIFSLQNLRAIAALARKHNIKTIIDNTWATPIFQKPLKLGIDIEIHSCSKYIGGHSDVVSGVIIGKEEDIKSIALREAALLGAKMAPFEAWLILRSLRTLKIRMLAHQDNTLAIARFLDSHSEVKKVYYPGLESHDQYDLGKEQMTGYTGLLAFDLICEDLNKIKKFVNNLVLFKIGVSWGGHESLVYAPAISYLKELSSDQFKAMNISLGTIRISVGLEDKEDLIADLMQAFKYISASDIE